PVVPSASSIEASLLAASEPPIDAAAEATLRASPPPIVPAAVSTLVEEPDSVDESPEIVVSVEPSTPEEPERSVLWGDAPPPKIHTPPTWNETPPVAEATDEPADKEESESPTADQWSYPERPSRSWGKVLLALVVFVLLAGAGVLAFRWLQ